METTEKQNGNGVRDTILLVYDIVYFLKELPYLSICSFTSLKENLQMYVRAVSTQ